MKTFKLCGVRVGEPLLGLTDAESGCTYIMPNRLTDLNINFASLQISILKLRNRSCQNALLYKARTLVNLKRFVALLYMYLIIE